jgi:hypothetical protein
MHTARRFAAAGLGAVALAALVPAASASAAPGDYKSRSTVTYWTVVRADDENGRAVAVLGKNQWVKIKAMGRADCNENDNSDACLFDADGRDAAAPDNWLAPGLRQFSLVGAVGDGDPVQLGTDRTKLRGKGEVRVAYNDLLGAYDDNRGGFLLKITKCRWGC